MASALMALGVISLVELLLRLPAVWRWRKPLALILICSLSLASLWLMIVHLSVLAISLLILSLYRVINLLRLVKGRIADDYLFHTARRTSVWLIGLQLLVAVGVAVLSELYIEASVYVYILVGAQLTTAAVLLTTVNRTKRTSTPPHDIEGFADRDLPALTVAIPARNETKELEDCLRSLIDSTYPKLEILVLDDCSQNRHTSEIIRGFAHDGVRFVAGKVPPESWLAKNYAYAQLAAEANGELLLFCGVDTHFAPDSLKVLVKTLLAKKKSMLGVMPRNILPAQHRPDSLLVQTNRYAWEVALPRRSFNRPPVLSTCWLITRELLQATGGFEAVRHGVLQERYFARQAVKHGDGYSFLRSDDSIGITTQNSLPDQRATAIRIRYPQLHRRPELVALVSIAEIGLLIGPVCVLVGALVAQAWPLAVLSAVSFATGTAMYSRVASLTYQRLILSSFWPYAPAVLRDVALLNYSMWQYEFNEVIWKGRNVCVPVMRAYPNLPKI